MTVEYLTIKFHVFKCERAIKLPHFLSHYGILINKYIYIECCNMSIYLCQSLLQYIKLHLGLLSNVQSFQNSITDCIGVFWYSLQIGFFSLFNWRFYLSVTQDICRTEYFWCWILYSGNFGIQRQKLSKTITKLGAWEYILPIFFSWLLFPFFVSSLYFPPWFVSFFFLYFPFFNYIDQIIYSHVMIWTLEMFAHWLSFVMKRWHLVIFFFLMEPQFFLPLLLTSAWYLNWWQLP